MQPQALCGILISEMARKVYWVVHISHDWVTLPYPETWENFTIEYSNKLVLLPQLLSQQGKKTKQNKKTISIKSKN